MLPRPGCFIGAMPGTQCLGISHSIFLIVGKSLDQKSQGSTATADIRSYHVSFNLVRIGRYLVHKGCDPVAVAGCAPVQISLVLVRVY